MQQLLDHGADVLIHLGDVGTVQVLDALAVHHPTAGGQMPAHVVFGNTDWDHQALRRYALDLGIAVHEPAGLIEVDGMTVGFTHGHQPMVMQGLLDEAVTYLLHGHTHQPCDLMRGQTRVINPGALFRARRHTAAILTPQTGKLELIEIASVLHEG